MLVGRRGTAIFHPEDGSACREIYAYLLLPVLKLEGLQKGRLLSVNLSSLTFRIPFREFIRIFYFG